MPASPSSHLSLTLTALLLALPALLQLQAADWPQWRGPQRNGSTHETGLLREWPAEGPRLEWTLAHTGAGYGAPAVVGNHLYLLANDGMDNEFVQAHRTDTGERVWRTRIGAVGTNDVRMNFAAARSTPTVRGSLLYALGSNGDIACLEAADGRLRWQKNLREAFGGRPGLWAYAESPLLEGDTVICTPGGPGAALVALAADSGALRWKCATPEDDEAAFASAIALDAAGVRHIVQLLPKGLVGVEAATGRLLWRYPRAVSRFNANIPTPVASGDIVYVASAGTGGGAVRIEARDGSITATELYFENKLPTAIGGIVKVGDQLYGTTGQALLCVEFATGKILWEERALGTASLCAADSRLYLHGENGDVALVEPSPEGYRERGRFTPPGQQPHAQPMEKDWTPPVVAHGRLYLRDRDLLWCYDVRAPRNQAALP